MELLFSLLGEILCFNYLELIKKLIYMSIFNAEQIYISIRICLCNLWLREIKIV